MNQIAAVYSVSALNNQAFLPIVKNFNALIGKILQFRTKLGTYFFEALLIIRAAMRTVYCEIALKISLV